MIPKAEGGKIEEEREEERIEGREEGIEREREKMGIKECTRDKPETNRKSLFGSIPRQE